jgi:hypothetical protein
MKCELRGACAGVVEIDRETSWDEGPGWVGWEWIVDVFVSEKCVGKKKERGVGRMWIAFHIMSSSYLAHLVARRKFNSGPDPSIHPSISLPTAPAPPVFV